MLKKLKVKFKKSKKVPYCRNSDKIINKREEKACQLAYYIKNEYNIIYIDETSLC